jgi:transcription-repair coupling factor (superfamily II helicase)
MERYRAAPQVRFLAEKLAEGHKVCQLAGLVGAQRAFAIAATAQVARTHADAHLVICEGKDEAAYLLNDLSTLLSGEQVFFFPDSFKRPAFFEEINPTHVLQRSETVHKITAAEQRPFSPVVVTYPEALFEQVVLPEVLEQTKIVIKKGEKLDTDFVIQVLIEYGFSRSDYVYEPGQFSIRGGIIDLFSYGNELPYRIELFDDEVESIRTFDPLDQLSVQRLESVSIIPNLNTRFGQSQKASLLRVLPERTVIWIKDTQFLLDRLQACFERAETFAQKVKSLDSAEVREIFRDRAFVYPAAIVEDMGALARVVH